MSAYEQNRYDIVTLARNFGEKAMQPLSEKERATIDANEKLVQENEARTAGNKAEEAAKKIQPQA